MTTDKSMTEDEFLGKVEWEGGIVEALEYGMRAGMLIDQKSELAKLWKHLEQSWLRMQPLLRKVEHIFENWQEADNSFLDDDEEAEDYPG